MVILTYTNRVHTTMIDCFHPFSLFSQSFENPILTVGHSFLNSRNNCLIFNRSKHFWCFVITPSFVTDTNSFIPGQHLEYFKTISEKFPFKAFPTFFLHSAKTPLSFFNSLAHLTLYSVTPNSWTVFLIL